MQQIKLRWITLTSCLALTACGVADRSQLASSANASIAAPQSGVMMQYFHWYLPADGSLWRKLVDEAPQLAAKGISSLWLPPAQKAISGANDVGYAVYDLYDLGEFDQKGSIRTKYGTKDEYLAAIDAAHRVGLSVYADIVINHRVGSDVPESAEVVRVDANDRRTEIGNPFQAQVYTGFTFPGRRGKYSNFTWGARHFDGVDTLANNGGARGVFRMASEGKQWEQDVSQELGNYDYLIGADLDMNQPEVQKELNTWGEWFTTFSGVDGFRLDAVKHIEGSYFDKWLADVRDATQRQLFAVGEYWDYQIGRLLAYTRARNQAGENLSVFDAPLHLNFFNAGRGQGSFDMSKIFQGTLV